MIRSGAGGPPEYLVAVKCIKPGLSTQKQREESVALQEEATTMATASGHPNVVSLSALFPIPFCSIPIHCFTGWV